MENEIPKINFSKEENLDIEVMNFEQLFIKLKQSTGHDPFAIHRINFYFILVVTKDTYTHYVDFKPYNLIEGSVIFVAKNQIHYFSKQLLESDGFCVVFNRSFLDGSHFLSGGYQFIRLFNYHIETPVIHPHEMGQDSLVHILESLHREYIFPNAFAKKEILSSMLHTLLLKAERAKEIQAIDGVKTQWLEIFNQFRTMLETEYINTRNSRKYASQLFISYKFLNDIVKRLTGKTVKSFIDDFVTIEIKRFLISTSLSVNEISDETGFEEPANMIKFFKKHTGITPLKFRQRL